MDRLSIVAHDRFQEIVDEANRSDSAIRLQQIILDPSTDLRGSRTVVARSNLDQQILGTPDDLTRSRGERGEGDSDSADSASPRDALNAPVPVFATEAERKLAVILDREADKWFRPVCGQFQIFYKSGIDQSEYVPDFVAETENVIYMLEPKARNEMENAEVLAKRDSAVTYCSRASRHSATTGGKPWKYLLIPHDEIAENMTLAGLSNRYGVLA